MKVFWLGSRHANLVDGNMVVFQVNLTHIVTHNKEKVSTIRFRSNYYEYLEMNQGAFH